MPRGSHFLLRRQKKVTNEEATPTIVLILRCSEKSGTKKTRYAQTVFRSNRFFLPLLGANQRGPVEPIFDRFAMRTTRAQMRASGWHHHHGNQMRDEDLWSCVHLSAALRLSSSSTDSGGRCL